MKTPPKYYSKSHKAYLPDLNKCPGCGETLCVGASGKIYCASNDETCKILKVGQLTKKAMKIYFPNK